MLYTKLVFGCLLILLHLSVFAQGDVLSEYKLGSGDKINISVFNEPDLSMEVVLTDAGTVSYPFLGEIEVKGLTSGELEKKIIDGLKGPYLIDPQINVTIIQYRNFYIEGEVITSGGYPFQPGLTVRKAVTLAGGFTERAAKEKIVVIREADEEQKPQPIKLDDPIFPGDTITVEQSFF